MSKIEYITFYDLEGYLVAQFDSYKECADYFKTTKEVIRCNISRRKRHYPNRKIRDRETHTWGYLLVDYKNEKESI